MKKNIVVRMLCLAAALVLAVCLAPMHTETYGLDGLESKDWIENLTVKELYNGVTAYQFQSKEDSAYKLNQWNIVEFDPAQSDLYVDVTNTEQYTNKLKSVQQTLVDFTANNGQGKTAIAGVNGDMWMVSYAHARILGRADLVASTYKAYANDAVVTQSLPIPRGFNMYNGEIISTAHHASETPYEGDFTAFGFSADGQAELGKPVVTITVTDLTIDETVKPYGINRLPANNAIMMYTDKGPSSNYALEDAYEIFIDFDEDYVIKHGTDITGTITAITKEGDEDLPMKENRIILTARGKRISKVENFKVGDKVQITISVKDSFGNTEFWQNVQNAVGGHMEFARDGKYSSLGGESGYPTTIIAKTKAGKMLFIVVDGRQAGYSVGLPFTQYAKLAKELDLEDGFIVDGGGSATMVQLEADGYKVVNRPSDKKSDGSYGSPRTVVNSIILSYGRDRNAPEETATPEPVVTDEPVATEAPATSGNSGNKSGGGLSTNTIIIIVGAVLVAAIAVVTAVVLGKNKKKS